MTIAELIKKLSVFPPQASVRMNDWLNREPGYDTVCDQVRFLAPAPDLYASSFPSTFEGEEDVSHGVVILDASE